MKKVLRPERLDADPNTATAAQDCLHWKATFRIFLDFVPQYNLNKRNVLINFVSPRIFSLTAGTENYDAAIRTLKGRFVKPKNEVYARHKLATKNQLSPKTIDGFLATSCLIALHPIIYH